MNDPLFAELKFRENTEYRKKKHSLPILCNIKDFVYHQIWCQIEI